MIRPQLFMVNNGDDGQVEVMDNFTLLQPFNTLIFILPQILLPRVRFENGSGNSDNSMRISASFESSRWVEVFRQIGFNGGHLLSLEHDSSVPTVVYAHLAGNLADRFVDFNNISVSFRRSSDLVAMSTDEENFHNLNHGAMQKI